MNKRFVIQELRTCFKITIRLIWGKYAPVLPCFFRQTDRDQVLIIM